MYYGDKRDDSLNVPAFYNQYLQIIDISRIHPLDGKIKNDRDYDVYFHYVGKNYTIPQVFDSTTTYVYKKRTWANLPDEMDACRKYCDKLKCFCSDQIYAADCKWEYKSDLENQRNKKKEFCKQQVNKESCVRDSACQWIDIP